MHPLEYVGRLDRSQDPNYDSSFKARRTTDSSPSVSIGVPYVQRSDRPSASNEFSSNQKEIEVAVAHSAEGGGPPKKG